MKSIKVSALSLITVAVLSGAAYAHGDHAAGGTASAQGTGCPMHAAGGMQGHAMHGQGMAGHATQGHMMQGHAMQGHRMQGQAMHGAQGMGRHMGNMGQHCGAPAPAPQK